MLTVSKRGRAVPTTWHVTGNLECIYMRNGWEELFNRILEEEKIIKISFIFAIVEKSYLFLLMFLTREATAYSTLLYCACRRPWQAGKQPSTNTVCLIKKLPSWVWWCMPLLPTPGIQDWVPSKPWLHCETLTENFHKLVKCNRVFQKSLIFIPILYLQVNPSANSHSFKNSCT